MITYTNEQMKYLNIFAGLLVLSLSFFSCAEHDRKSSQKISATSGVYTKKQVESGSVLYTNYCAACHGKDLRGTEGGGALDWGTFFDQMEREISGMNCLS